MIDEPKASTFTIHHDRCDPSKWTAGDVTAFADFVRTGDLRYAAHLSRLGVQLVLSEKLEPKGGDIQQVGWCESRLADLNDIAAWELEDVANDEDITPIVPVYRGPTQYAARFAVANEFGDHEGTEIELFKTEAEAEKFLTSLREAGNPYLADGSWRP